MSFVLESLSYKDLSSSILAPPPVLIHLHVYVLVTLKRGRSNDESHEGADTGDPAFDFEQEMSQTKDEEEGDNCSKRIIAQEDREMRPHQEGTELVDLGVGSERKELVALLRDYQDIFA